VFVLALFTTFGDETGVFLVRFRRTIVVSIRFRRDHNLVVVKHK
jgi:hypothetical protein